MTRVEVKISAKVEAEKDGVVTLSVATYPLSKEGEEIIKQLFPNFRSAVEDLLVKEAFVQSILGL